MRWNPNRWMIPKDTRSTKERAKTKAKEALEQMQMDSISPEAEEEESAFSELILEHENKQGKE